MIHIREETAWHSLQKMKWYCEKKLFKNFGLNFWKLCIGLEIFSSFIVNSRIIICISDERAWHLYKKIKGYFKNIYCLTILDISLEKICSALLTVEWCFAYLVKGINALLDWIFENLIFANSSIIDSDHVKALNIFNIIFGFNTLAF